MIILIKKLLFYLVMFFYFSTANAWNWRSVYNLEPDISDSKEEKFNWLVHEIKNKFEKKIIIFLFVTIINYNK